MSKDGKFDITFAVSSGVKYKIYLQFESAGYVIHKEEVFVD
jgi:hypothetical protein